MKKMMKQRKEIKTLEMDDIHNLLDTPHSVRNFFITSCHFSYKEGNFPITGF